MKAKRPSAFDVNTCYILHVETAGLQPTQCTGLNFLDKLWYYTTRYHRPTYFCRVLGLMVVIAALAFAVPCYLLTPPVGLECTLFAAGCLPRQHGYVPSGLPPAEECILS